MKTFVAAVLAGSFMFGFSTEDVDARARHKGQNYLWHKGENYKSHKTFKKRRNRKQNSAMQKPIVVAHVYIGAQRMIVDVNGQRLGIWAVSTGEGEYRTPDGTFRAKRLEREWYSTQYDNAPMPYSVFFHRGYAVHGTNHLRSLGKAVSHGCVRLHPSQAAEFYRLVEMHGLNRTQIIVSD